MFISSGRMGQKTYIQRARNIVEQEHLTNLNHKKVEVRQWYRTGLKFTESFLKKFMKIGF